MFLTLLLVTFLIALGVSALVARLFRDPVEGILRRLISDPISAAWVRYLKFALYVVGISGGVRIWELERYITPQRLPRQVAPGQPFDYEEVPPLVLDQQRWVLEVYRTVISTLQSIAWMLLVFFVFALIAYVVVRLSESRKTGN